jgi:hypothetical protein
VLCPALSVSGTVKPLRLKPVPLAVAAEMVRLVPPELVSVPDRGFELPTGTLPKLRLAGLGVIWPCATPVPDSGTDKVALVALELMVIEPLAAPALAGANLALNVADWPAAMVVGNDGPVKLKPVPETDALDTVTLVPPVFETTTAVVWLLPTVTLPKPILLGFAVRDPGASPVPERPTFSGELASEVIVRLPFTAPADAGAKTTWKETL